MSTEPASTEPGGTEPMGAAASDAGRAPVTKAVILARGLGTRMRRPDEHAGLDERQAAIAATGIKALMDVGRPFLDHHLGALAAVGIREVCLVIGPEHETLRDYARRTDAAAGRLRITWAVQDHPRGTADALAAAGEFIGTERAVVLNADNHYPATALATLVSATGAATLGFDREALVAASNIPPERVGAFAIIEQDARGRLRGLIEKPDAALLEALGPDAPVSMNAWLVTPRIVEACRRVQPSVRGELELVDAVMLAVAEGEEVRVIPAACGVLDLSSRADVAAVRDALADVEVVL